MKPTLEVLRFSSPLDRQTDIALRRLFEDCRSASPYCHPLWVASLADAFGLTTGWRVVRSQGQWIAALPYVRRRFPTALVSMVESLPYDCYASPLLRPNLPSLEAAEAVRALYRAVAAESSVARFFPADWSGSTATFPVGDFKHAQRHCEDIYIKSFDGLVDEDALIETYSHHHRKQVRIANRSSLEFSMAKSFDDLRDFYKILGETMHRVGRPVKFPLDLIVNGGLRLIQAGLGACYLSRDKGRICSGAFVLRSKAATIYWLGATTNDKALLRHFPAYGVLHRAILDSMRSGGELFEFGAAPNPGLLDFKAKWGAHPVRQTRYTVGGKLMLSLLALRARLHAPTII